MAPLKRILLVEDNERDLELTMAALEEHNLVNEVVVARDGAEALDYLYNRGKFAGHANGFPVVVMLDLKNAESGRAGGFTRHEKRSVFQTHSRRDDHVLARGTGFGSQL
jgi:CheY-like chemotaxis protein